MLEAENHPERASAYVRGSAITPLRIHAPGRTMRLRRIILHVPASFAQKKWTTTAYPNRAPRGGLPPWRHPRTCGATAAGCDRTGIFHPFRCDSEPL